jgi:peptide-methionine (R)-S-oxide reductase
MPKTEDEWKTSLNGAVQVLRKHATERRIERAQQRKAAQEVQCAGCGKPLFSSDTKFEWHRMAELLGAARRHPVETTTDRACS